MIRDDTEDDPERHESGEEDLEATAINKAQSRVTLEEVLEVRDGAGIAVRAIRDTSERILAGRVRWDGASDANPVERIDQQLEDCASAIVCSIEADLWWEIADGEITDRSEELEDRPLMQQYLADPPKTPPSCSLACREDGRVTLTIPMPVRNHSRVLYYAPDNYGTVIALKHGDIVSPETLLQDIVDEDGCY